ncbi:MAG: hypothetical protein ACTSXH_12640 [Promethearchaeota archaeon]
MKKKLEIGKEAKELDEKSFKERMKIDKDSLTKIIGALLIYLFVMLLFSIYL